MKKKSIRLFLAAITITLMMFLSGCSGVSDSTATLADDSIASTVSTLDSADIYSDFDLDASYDAETATLINLSNSGSDITGSGATVAGSLVTITDAGTYIISGTLDAGQIIVNAADSDNVQLVLDNVTLTSLDGPAIYELQSDKTKITLAEGSNNTISDSSTYSDTAEDAANAAIYALHDLTINGTGTLNVNGNYQHAVNTKDDLVITGGTYVINAIEEGLRGHDSVAIAMGYFTINSDGDGIKSDQEDDSEKGWVSIDGGTFKIDSTNGGIQAETILAVKNGDITITSVDDCLHSNTDMIISGGTLTLSTDDDGIHSDNDLSIKGGTITVNQAYEGLEAANIYLSGGVVTINAENDGLNAAGLDNTSEIDDNGQQSPSGNYLIDISGGYLYVNIYGSNEGDGIDSNGDLNISGGTVIVSSTTSERDSYFDTGDGDDYTFNITGGTIVAAGTSRMLTTADTASQGSATIVYDATQSGGTLANLSDTDGNSILSFIPANAYDCITFSSPELSVGNTYTLSSGGNDSGASEDSILFANGSYSVGTELCTFTMADFVTNIYSDGSIFDMTTNQQMMPGGQSPRPVN